MIEDFIDISLLHGKLENTLSAQEEELFNIWYEASEAHRIYFERFCRQRGKTECRELSRVDANAAYRRFKRREGGKRLWRMVAVAVSFVLLAGIAFSLLRVQQSEDENLSEPVALNRSVQAVLKLSGGMEICLDSTHSGMMQGALGKLLKGVEGNVPVEAVVDTGYRELIVPTGGEYRLQLADGTEVYVNANTCLKYPARFNAQVRDIYMEGEAYFKVAHGGRPFIVRTSKGAIRVYGTEFNVMTYREETQQQITLVEGSVGVSVGGEAFRKIRPGEQFVIDNVSGATHVREVDVMPYVAWKDGLFVAQNETLDAIMRKIARWYGVEVFYQEPSLKEKRFFAIMKRQARLNEILEIITAASGIRFQTNGRVVTVLR